MCAHTSSYTFEWINILFFFENKMGLKNEHNIAKQYVFEFEMFFHAKLNVPDK